MSRVFATVLSECLALAALIAGPLIAQQQKIDLTLPLASPRAELRQVIGLTEVDVRYHRPAVDGRKIWGDLVPYGQVWRTGANENTLISFTTDVTVEGQRLAAGTYGLHTLPGETEWQVMLSRDTQAWGSFSYDEGNDALRVEIQPQEGPFVERLTFSFDDLSNDGATLSLRWERLHLPIRIAVSTHEIALASIREQLKGLPQFFWNGWNEAADYCLQNEVNLEEGLQWAESSIQVEERFENLATKSQILEKTGDEARAVATMERALEVANAGQLHQYGRQLIGQGQKEKALEIFKRNAERNPDTWFIGVGLARGFSALGDFGRASENMRMALEKAPESQKGYIQSLVEQLEVNQDIN